MKQFKFNLRNYKTVIREAVQKTTLPEIDKIDEETGEIKY
jgi:hypothetical protein